MKKKTNTLRERLTPRQLEIIEIVKQHERIEYDRKAAAEELGLSSNTVDSHLQTVFKICNVNSFNELLEKLDMVD